MSQLRRSRPDDHDESLKKLQEISVARMEVDEEHIYQFELSSHNSSDVAHSDCEIKNVYNSNGKLPLEEPHTKTNDELVSFEASMKGAGGTDADIQVLPPEDNLQLQEAKIMKRNLSHPLIEIQDSSTTNPHELISNSSHEEFKPSKSLLAPRKITPTSVSLSPILPRLMPPLNPSFKCLSHGSLDSPNSTFPTIYGSASSPPSRKFLKFVLPPPVLLSAVKRRGSEPILDSTSQKDYHHIQKNITDRRWEKLRSILEAMKSEPFDVDKLIEISPCDSSSVHTENVNRYGQLVSLQEELASVQNQLLQKELMHQQAIQERNAAMAYIRLLKSNNLSHDTEDVLRDSNLACTASCGFEVELDRLKKQAVTKIDVLDFLVQVVHELNLERTYLNQLMAAVLQRAPWILDEVEKTVTLNIHDQEETDEHKECEDNNTSTDDEVWC